MLGGGKMRRYCPQIFDTKSIGIIDSAQRPAPDQSDQVSPHPYMETTMNLREPTPSCSTSTVEQQIIMR